MFVPPLSFGGPRATSASTARLRGSDPDPGTFIGAPVDAVCFTVICMTWPSGGAGVDTGSGGSVFVMSSVWPANPRKSQITSYRSAGVITSPFDLAGFTGSSPPSVPTMVIGTAVPSGAEICRSTIRALQPFSTRNRYTAGSTASFGQILPLTSITSPKYSPIHGPFVPFGPDGATGYSSDPSALNCRSCTTIGSS